MAKSLKTIFTPVGRCPNFSSSLRSLRELCVSAVNLPFNTLTADAQSTRRGRREFQTATLLLVALILLAACQYISVSRQASAQPIRTSTNTDGMQPSQRQSPLKLPLVSPAIVVKK